MSENTEKNIPYIIDGFYKEKYKRVFKILDNKNMNGVENDDSILKIEPETFFKIIKPSSTIYYGIEDVSGHNTGEYTACMLEKYTNDTGLFQKFNDAYIKTRFCSHDSVIKAKHDLVDALSAVFARVHLYCPELHIATVNEYSARTDGSLSSKIEDFINQCYSFISTSMLL